MATVQGIDVIVEHGRDFDTDNERHLEITKEILRRNVGDMYEEAHRRAPVVDQNKVINAPPNTRGVAKPGELRKGLHLSAPYLTRRNPLETGGKPGSYGSDWLLHANVELDVPYGKHVIFGTGKYKVKYGLRRGDRIEVHEDRDSGSKPWKMPTHDMLRGAVKSYLTVEVGSMENETFRVKLVFVPRLYTKLPGHPGGADVGDVESRRSHPPSIPKYFIWSSPSVRTTEVKADGFKKRKDQATRPGINGMITVVGAHKPPKQYTIEGQKPHPFLHQAAGKYTLRMINDLKRALSHEVAKTMRDTKVAVKIKVHEYDVV